MAEEEKPELCEHCKREMPAGIACVQKKIAKHCFWYQERLKIFTVVK
jgi:hypothetical protein